jgi:hypothetical protein
LEIARVIVRLDHVAATRKRELWHRNGKRFVVRGKTHLRVHDSADHFDEASADEHAVSQYNPTTCS